jgi:hypothetical protein
MTKLLFSVLLEARSKILWYHTILLLFVHHWSVHRGDRRQFLMAVSKHCSAQSTQTELVAE